MRLRTDDPRLVADVSPRAEAITRERLARIGTLWEALLTRNLATD